MTSSSGFLARSGRTALAALSIVASTLSAQELPEEVRTIGVEDGLPHSVVVALAQDSRGFLWIGGSAGLARFDGAGITVFQNDPGDPASFPVGTVRDIATTPSGEVWVAVQGVGVAFLRRGAARFQVIASAPAEPGGLPSPDVYSIYADSRGSVWVGARRGQLAVIDRTTLQIRSTRVVREVEGVGPDLQIGALAEDEDGTIWAGTFSGALHRIDPATLEIRDIPLDLESERRPVPIRALHASPEGELWVGTAGSGVARLLLDGSGDPVWFRSSGRPGGISHDDVMDIQPGDGSLWIATYGGGINRLDPETGRFEWLVDPLSDPRTTSVLRSRDGSYWVGTWGAGLNGFTLPLPGLTPFVPGGSRGLEGSDVAAVHHRPGMSEVLVASYDHGLHRLDIEAGRMRASPIQPPLDGVVSPRFFRVLQAGDGRIYAGTFGWGLFVLDPDAPSYRQVPGDAVAPGSSITTLAEDGGGRIWIGTNSGLAAFRPGEPAQTITPEFLVGDGESPWIQSLDLLPGGSFLVGTSVGLAVLDPRTGQGRWLHGGPPAHPPAGERWSVNEVARAPDGSIWVALDQGVRRLEVEDLAGGAVVESRPVRTDQLPNPVVKDLVFDAAGRLWLSTEGGLAEFDPATGRARSFFESDGLAGDDGASGALAVVGERVVFGSTGGLTVIHPPSIPPLGPAPEVAVTGLRRVVDRGSMLSPLPPEAVEIPWGRGSLLFEFAVIDLRASLPATYEYRLSEDDDWTPLGTTRTVAFANAEPGSYRLEVRAHTARGQTTEPSSPIRIRVVPPWWLTPWARVLGAVVLVGLAYLLYRLRTRRIRRHNMELEGQIRERERAEAERDRLERQFVQSQKLEAVGKLTGGVAHDFNNILTIIRGNLELLAADRADDAEVQARTGPALDASRKAAVLTRSLLSFSRKQMLSPQAVDIGELAGRLRELLGPSFGELYRLQFRVEDDLPAIRVDEAHLESALVNLFINARDAQPGGGPIEFRARRRSLDAARVREFDVEGAELLYGDDDRSRELVELAVVDEGSGMADEVLERALEPFFTTKADAEGSGLGLSMVYGFVRQSRGLLQLESGPTGTTVRLFFPAQGGRRPVTAD